MDGSWHDAARRGLFSTVGVLLLGLSGTAQADHNREFEIEINTPNLSTRFASSPRYYYGGRYYDSDWRNCPPPHRPPRGYYSPGYWQWQPPHYHGHNDWRGEHRRDDRYWRDDRAYRHDNGRHRGWEKHRHRADHRRDDRHDRRW